MNERSWSLSKISKITKHISVKYSSDGVVFKRKFSISFFVVCFLLICLASLITYKLCFANWSQISVNTVALPVVAKQDLKINWPAEGQAAISAVGSPVILEPSKTQVPSATASVAKLMTALAILKKHPLKLDQAGPTVTMTSRDINIFQSYVSQDGSILPVKPGEEFSEYQALQAMLLPSANNMADSMAIWAYGSLENYHKAANQLAKSLGMNQSRFADDASGFSPNTTSTPHDLVLLGKAALKNSVIKQITAQKTAVSPYVGTIYNTNQLLGENGFSGLKTGFTPQAGYCLLFATTRKLNKQKVTLVGSISEQNSRSQSFSGANLLADSAYSNLQTINVVKKGQIVANYSTPWQATTPALSTAPLSILAWNNESPEITVKPTQLSSFQPAGTKVGFIQSKTSFGSKSTDLLLRQSINKPPATWRLLHWPN